MRNSILSAVLMGAMAACGTSPTTPSIACDTAHDSPLADGGCLTILDDAALLPLRDSVRAWITPVVARAATELDVSGVRIRVSGPGPRVIAGFGVGGFASPERVEMEIDPNDAGRPEGLRAWVEQITAHELHHVARLRAVGYPRTVAGLAAFEGLADRYAIDFGARTVPPWSAALEGAELAHWRNRVVAEHPQHDFSAPEWLFGTTPEIPHWTGYAVGYAIAGDYLQVTGSTAARSTGASDDDIVDAVR